MMYDRIFFVDFDGTITAEETMVGSIRKMVEPELYEAYEKRMLSGEMTLSAGLKEAFSKIPSSAFAMVPAYIDRVPIREGFESFLDAAARKSIPVVVISGGLGQSVRRKLKPYEHKILDIYSADLDLTGQTMRLSSRFDDGMELVAKRKVMGRYQYRHAYCVGDSYTDVRMAMVSDEVFARDQLAKILDTEKKAYHPWDTFVKIANWIEHGFPD